MNGEQQHKDTNTKEKSEEKKLQRRNDDTLSAISCNGKVRCMKLKMKSKQKVQ